MKKEMKAFPFSHCKLSTKNIITLYASDDNIGYQRPLNEQRVKKIASNFNPNLVNEIKVSHRDGNYYSFDGNHTMHALILLNGGKDLMVDCKVYEGMSYEEEALMFAEQNGIEQKVLSEDKLKAMYEAGDIDVIDMRQIIESTGIRCPLKKGCANNKKIGCYANCFKIYKKHGGEKLKEILQIIVEVWDADATSLRKEIINGLLLFNLAYSDKYKLPRLISKLQKVSSNVVLRDGQADKHYTGDRRFAGQILKIYNKGAGDNQKLDSTLIESLK